MKFTFTETATYEYEADSAQHAWELQRSGTYDAVEVTIKSLTVIDENGREYPEFAIPAANDAQR